MSDSMIVFDNVSKSYQDGIDAISEVNLRIDRGEFVFIIGNSGAGKSTLIKLILKEIDPTTGKIYVNGRFLNRLRHSKTPLLRRDIGVVFQDFRLLNDRSVYDNVAFAQKVIEAPTSKIKRRVTAMLALVGLAERYKSYPGELSGGEKQRVGIARAIVKNPSIIIADEPTGNLDSKNTIEIMNIIKAISLEKLVILVTHEKDLAHFYASRIVSLEDGKVISDIENEHENELDYRIDNKIYLKDFKKHDNIKDKTNKIDIYSDEDEILDLDIVIKNGNLYIKSNKPNKIEVIDADSNIEFINEHYKKITKADYADTNFDLSKLDNSKYKLRYTTIYNIFTMIKTGFKKVMDYSFMKKALLVGFLISAMFIVFAISNTFGNLNIRDEKFIEINRDYIVIKNSKNKVDEILSLERDEHINYILPGNSSVNFQLVSNDIYQFDSVKVNVSGSLASAKLVSNIIYGRNISTNNEIVLDKMTLDRALQSEEFKMIGITKYEDFLSRNLKVNNMSEFTIVGISDTNSPSIYIDDVNFVNVVANSIKDEVYSEESKIIDYSLAQNITIKKGRIPEGDYEVIVNIDNKDSMPLSKKIDTKVNGKKLTVVGYYYSPRNINDYYVNTNTIKYNNIKNNNSMVIYANDKDATIKYLQSIGYNARDSYTDAKDTYIKEAKSSIIQSLIIAGILLFISFIEIFLMIRASFLSRIKEVGIYRAVGVKKIDIYKMFLGEILVITTLASVPGYILMSLIISELTKIKYLKDMFVLDIRVLIICIVLIYGLNIIMGLLPVRGIIRKTPAEILARNDVD